MTKCVVFRKYEIGLTNFRQIEINHGWKHMCNSAAFIWNCRTVDSQRQVD